MASRWPPLSSCPPAAASPTHTQQASIGHGQRLPACSKRHRCRSRWPCHQGINKESRRPFLVAPTIQERGQSLSPFFTGSALSAS